MKKTIIICLVLTLVFACTFAVARAETNTDSQKNVVQWLFEKIHNFPQRAIGLFKRNNTAPVTKTTDQIETPKTTPSPSNKQKVAPVTKNTSQAITPTQTPSKPVSDTSQKLLVTTEFEILPLTQPNTLPDSGNLNVQVLCKNKCPFLGAPTTIVEKNSLKKMGDSVSDQAGLTQFKNVAPGTYIVTAHGDGTSAQGEFVVYSGKITVGKIFLPSYTSPKIPAPSSITFTSPKAGDRWARNTRQTITWDPGTIPADHTLSIRFEGHWPGGGYLEFFSSTNDGREEISVPATATIHSGYRIIFEYKVNGKVNLYKSPEFEVVEF